MKTIQTCQYWFETLPRHIQEQVKQNALAQNKDLDHYLTQERLGSGFIGGIFTWADSKEKEQYWLAINNMYTANKISPQDFERLYEKFPEHSKKLESVINNYPIF